jgi:uncharacterized protein YvpB
MRRFIALVALLTLAACAGPEQAEPTPAPAVPAAAVPRVAGPTPATVVVVTSNQRPVPGVPAGAQIVAAQIAIPTAVPTRVLPTATPTPQPIGAAKGRTFPALFPPDLAGQPDARWLPVPYRSQLDGNPYEMADCGPSSLAMVLAAYGKDVPTMDVRKHVNKLQGTEGAYDSGTFIENIFWVAKSYGMRPNGLWPNPQAKNHKKWTLDEVRAKLDDGQPIIPQVWYRGLPGRESKAYNGDHYIVLIGYAGDDFLYNDPIDKDGPGYARRISAAQLDKAWRNSDFPYAGVAIGGPPERASLLGPSTFASARIP